MVPSLSDEIIGNHSQEQVKPSGSWQDQTAASTGSDREFS